MTTTICTDTILIERVARGDADALASLYDRHGRAAYGLALRVLRDRALAEDAVQEAFLAVWRGAAGFDPTRSTVSSWLLVLVHRRAVDLVRKAERQRAEALPPEFELASEERIDQQLVDAETAVRVRRALLRLTHAQREVIELAFFAGLSQSEVAARLGVPLGTVKSRTFAGLERLQALLADEQRAEAPPLAPALPRQRARRLRVAVAA